MHGDRQKFQLHQARNLGFRFKVGFGFVNRTFESGKLSESKTGTVAPAGTMYM
jgi:hypothetical protein